MWKTPSLQNGMSQLNYKLIRHRLATCKFFHAFHPCLASTKRWLVVPPSDMLIVYKMNLWLCKNMIKIYSLQNACYLQNVLPNITLTVQNSSLQSFCRQLKFSHSVGEIVRGMDFTGVFLVFLLVKPRHCGSSNVVAGQTVGIPWQHRLCQRRWEFGPNYTDR